MVSKTTDTSLALIDSVHEGLQSIKTLVDALHVNSAALAAEAFYAAQGMEENAQLARIISLEAQRKAGIFLKNMPKNGGQLRRGQEIAPRDDTPTLADYDISKQQSYRWQMMADIPDSTFQEYIDRKLASGHEITVGGLIRVGEEKRGRRVVSQPHVELVGAEIEIVLNALEFYTDTFRSVKADALKRKLKEAWK